MIGIIVNQKGGVAKTTNTIHLSSALAKKGYKTLIIDFDPQCDLSHAIGVRDDTYNIVDFLNHKDGFRLKGKSDHLFVLPGSKEFISFDYPLNALKNALHKKTQKGVSISNYFDFIFIDTPPSKIINKSSKTFPPTEVEMALYASDFFMIPLFADDFSAKNANIFLGSVKEFIITKNLAIKFLGFFFGRILMTSKAKDFYIDLFKDNAKELLFETYIRSDAEVEKAQNAGKTIFQYNPSCRASEDYYNFTNEFLKKVGL